MGEVYSAIDTRLGQTVALKLLPESEASAELRRRFANEARRPFSSKSSEHHHHLRRVKGGCGLDDCDGVCRWPDSLATIPNGGLPASDVWNYATQIAAALGRAHRAGIVHRDLKPANVTVSRDGTIKLLVRLAKFKSPADETLTLITNPDHRFR